VQRSYNLSDGSVIRLTTARYFTPTGRCIQRPYENGTEEYYNEFRDRYQHGEYVYADSIKFPDSLKYSTPKGRTVYGGGGIMPDVFIPLDTSMYSDYFVDLRRKGIINQFTLDYVDKNREALNAKYPSLEEFIKGFDIDGEIEKQFIALVEKENVKFDEAGWAASGAFIKIQLKALIARNLWDLSAYYQIISIMDDEFQKAVEILQDEKIFHNLNIG
jgi:carboxyl-terminal processing protease